MKTYSTIGCCGIDCGLCPRFNSNGASACPGCCGKDFRDKHPSCGFVTCCVGKRGLETCADCSEFTCKRFDREGSGLDSFVTHRSVFPNLESIKFNGIDQFILQQRIRITVLETFLKGFDDGRSKSFYCLACALLPIEELNECRKFIDQIDESINVKEKSKMLRTYIQKIADALKIELKLNNKKNSA